MARALLLRQPQVPDTWLPPDVRKPLRRLLRRWLPWPLRLPEVLIPSMEAGMEVPGGTGGWVLCCTGVPCPPEYGSYAGFWAFSLPATICSSGPGSCHGALWDSDCNLPLQSLAPIAFGTTRNCQTGQLVWVKGPNPGSRYCGDLGFSRTWRLCCGPGCNLAAGCAGYQQQTPIPTLSPRLLARDPRRVPSPDDYLPGPRDPDYLPGPRPAPDTRPDRNTVPPGDVPPLLPPPLPDVIPQIIPPTAPRIEPPIAPRWDLIPDMPADMPSFAPGEQTTRGNSPRGFAPVPWVDPITDPINAPSPGFAPAPSRGRPTPLPSANPRPGEFQPVPGFIPGPVPAIIPVPGGDWIPGPAPSPAPGTLPQPGMVPTPLPFPTFVPGGIADPRQARPVPMWARKQQTEMVLYPPGLPPARYRQPGPREKERKFLPMSTGPVGRLVGEATELGDAIDCLHDGLPKKHQAKRKYRRDWKKRKELGKNPTSKPSLKRKAAAVYRNFDKINFIDATASCLLSMASDAATGKVNRTLGEAAKKHGHPFGFGSRLSRVGRAGGMSQI